MSKHYGLPCAKGHDGLRYSKRNNCFHCQAEKNERLTANGYFAAAQAKRRASARMQNKSISVDVL